LPPEPFAEVGEGDALSWRLGSFDLRPLARWWASKMPHDQFRKTLEDAAGANTAKEAHAILRRNRSSATYIIDQLSHPRCACGDLAVAFWRRRGHPLPVCRTHYGRYARTLAAKIINDAIQGILLASFLGFGRRPTAEVWCDEEGWDDDRYFAEAWNELAYHNGQEAPHFGLHRSWAEMYQEYRDTGYENRACNARIQGEYAVVSPGRRRIDDRKQVDEARRLIAQGFKQYEAADKVGMPADRLSRRLKEIRATGRD